jgi:hypothetical protein
VHERAERAVAGVPVLESSMLSTLSPVSRTVLLITPSLSGCISIDSGDDFVPDNDCSVSLRTSGAVSAHVREVDGCFYGATIVTGGDQTEVELTMGVSPRDDRPFDHVARSNSMSCLAMRARASRSRSC